MKVYYHSKDNDGILSGQIFKHWYGDTGADAVELIGWTHGDAPLDYPDTNERVVVVDLAPDDVFGPVSKWPDNLIWIDHHIEAIKRLPESIAGYRLDGVAACRLAWQWCRSEAGEGPLPAGVEDYRDHKVREPLAVRLLGEYDVWDKRDPRAEALNLAAWELGSNVDWGLLLNLMGDQAAYVRELLRFGEDLIGSRAREDEALLKRAFLADFDGLRVFAVNDVRPCSCFELVENSVERPEFDAYLKFSYDGASGLWAVSLRASRHRPDVDVGRLASKWGGGGHKASAGFGAVDLLEHLKNRKPLEGWRFERPF